MFVNFNRLDRFNSFEQIDAFYNGFVSYAEESQAKKGDPRSKQDSKKIQKIAKNIGRSRGSKNMKNEQEVVDDFGFNDLLLSLKGLISKKELKSLKSQMAGVAFDIANDEVLGNDIKNDSNNETIQSFNLTVDKSDFFEKYDKVFVLCQEAIKHKKALRVIVNSDMHEQSNNSPANYVYTKDEFQKLKELNDLLLSQNKPCELKISEYLGLGELNVFNTTDYASAWTLSDVVKANTSLDDVVEYIKINKMSPFEAMLYIHHFVTSNFGYKETENLERCRVIIGAFKDGTIVCSGYASMVKALVDKLNYPELKCDIVSTGIFEKNEEKIYKVESIGGHTFNLVTINDSKYDISGTFAEDACYDNKALYWPNGKGYSRCLFDLHSLDEQEEPGIGPVVLFNKSIKSSDRFTSLIAGDISYNCDKLLANEYSPSRCYHDQPTISFDVYKAGLQQISQYLYQDKDKQQEFVDQSIHYSKMVSSQVFTQNAKVCWLEQNVEQS